jgi:pyrimidine deaminase RibD-like protein/nicotinamide mononucleotide adenylyltransferase/GNAT superfamily N-acetyltransferase
MYATELFEQNKPRVVVTYPGRFQPFHQGHAGVFSQLQKKFGAENVFVLTSNDTSSAKSPFDFSDKYQLITAAGVPANHIVETNRMYILPDSFDPRTTVFVTAVGAPDKDRLNPDTVTKRDQKDKDGNITKPAGSPSYYRTWGIDQNPVTADQHGYVVVIPEIRKNVKIKNKAYDASHGTEVRQLWNSVRNDPQTRIEFLKQLYKNPHQDLVSIFNKIPETVDEDLAVTDGTDSTSPINGNHGYQDITKSVSENTNPANTLYFFDVGQGGKSFSHIDLKVMGLRQTKSGKWYYQPGRDSTDLLINASLKHLEKTLNVPAKAWQRPVAEDAAGVGVVAKNKKMAKDPRYSMSITKDVKPSTPKNMLRAFRLSEKWSAKYKKSINCDNPKGFSQRAHCQGRDKVDEEINPEDFRITNHEKLDDILVQLCKMIVTGKKKDSDYYGMVAACVLDTDNRAVFGINYADDATDTRVHAERAALDQYRSKYGEPPAGSIIITTCSPCSESMAERYGDSCTELINDTDIHKVYCGYEDPTQERPMNRTFHVMQTRNESIVELCRDFAKTFLGNDIKEDQEHGVKEKQMTSMIKEFLPLAMKELDLKKVPRIILQAHVVSNGEQATFGRFDNSNESIYLGIADRHPVDILRTLAHELVHFAQHQAGLLHPTAGETGSPIENEAHWVAGIIMRHFNKKYPDAVKMKPLALSENREQGVTEVRIIDDKRVDVYYRPVPNSRGRRVVARNIPVTTLDTLLQKLSEKYSVPVESFEWTVAQGMAEDASGLDFDMKFDDDTGSFATVTARAQGRILGSVKFFMDGDTLEADMVEVDERYRGQGIGAAMYDYAKSQGYTIEKSSDLTPDGEHFWNKNRGEEAVWEAEDQINELGNAPAEYKPNRKRSRSLFHATVDNHWVDVFFDRSEFNDTLHITFAVNNNYDTPSQPTSASRSTVKILSTVLNIVKQKLPEYMAKARPPAVSFTAKGDNRASLYRKYFVPVIQNVLGPKWQHEEYPSMGMTVFHWRPAKKQGITEAFDQPYAVQWTKQNGDWHATADLDDGSELIVLFMSQGDNNWMVEFERDENMDITGEGDAPRVFATVLTAMRQFIAKRKPARLNFSADKEDDPTGSRARLYDRMVQRYITGTGYDLTREDVPGGATYTLTKQQQGVAEGFDQPYPLKWEKSDYGDMDALAKLPDGSPLSIMFNLADMSENDWGVEFYRNNSQSVTGEGDAYRVFATVLNAISQFIKKKKPDTLFFTAVKEEDPTGSRAKLYDRLVQKYATGSGYDLKKVDYPEQTGYKLTRKEQGVTEGVYRGDWVRHPDNPWQIGQIQSIDNGQALVTWKKTDKRKKAMSSTHAVDALQHARREFSQLTQPTHTPGMAEDKSNDTAISLSKLGKFHPGADTLAQFVPERTTAQYALHPDKWESTFYSLTNKDSDKLKYYGPKKILIPPGTLVGDMAIANKFYRAKTTEEKQQYAEAYKASLQPYPVDVSEYRMPELLIPKPGVAENFADGKNPGRKGLAKRSGVNTKASVSSLRKTAKNSSGEKQRMAHWLANMKAGRAKAKKNG